MSHKRWARIMSANDVAVLAAILGFVAYGMFVVLEILGGHLLSTPGGLRILLLLLAALSPGALGVWAAWRGHSLVLWSIAALVVVAWIVWWREFTLSVPVPFFYGLAAFLTAVDRLRRRGGAGCPA